MLMKPISCIEFFSFAMTFTLIEMGIHANMDMIGITIQFISLCRYFFRLEGDDQLFQYSMDKPTPLSFFVPLSVSSENQLLCSQFYLSSLKASMIRTQKSSIFCLMVNPLYAH